MIGGLLRLGRPVRVLLDLREGGGMRGFHLAASVAHLIARGIKAEFWALHADNDDVMLEIELLRQDSGRSILRWRPEVRSIRFDWLVAMADDVPAGATWRAARGSARRVVLGLMFPDPARPPDRGVTILDGHDTRGFADTLAAMLGR